MSSASNTPSSHAADQARLRKERREAKIKAGGSARLDKITGLGGGFKRDPPTEPISATANDHTADPEEVDISEHYYSPSLSTRPRPSAQNAFTSSNPPQLSDEQLRAMMLGFPSSGANSNNSGTSPMSNPFLAQSNSNNGNPPTPDDPMLKILQQMMGANASAEGLNTIPSFPELSGARGSGGQESLVEADPYAYLWRIIHAAFALGLGLYIAFTTTFSGSKLDREMSVLRNKQGQDTSLDASSIQFFYIFASFEVLLQTSRFFLEKGTVQPSGVLGMVMGFLPPPWKGYVALMLRYSRIWTTVSSDAMVCLFVLGVCSWLRAS